MTSLINTKSTASDQVIASDWLDRSKCGFLGGRRRAVILRHSDGSVNRVQLVSQTAFGRLIDLIATIFGKKSGVGLTTTQLQVSDVAKEIWNRAMKDLGDSISQNLLTCTIKEVIRQSPGKIELALNNPIAILQPETSDYIGHLEYFSSSIGKEWERFVEEQLKSLKDKTSITNLNSEFSRKQKEILEKCRKEAIESIDDAIYQTTESSPKILAPFVGKQPEIDGILQEKHKEWTALKEKARAADTIVTLEACMDEILDAGIQDELLRDLLLSSLELSTLQESLQEKCKELLIQLDPKQTRFQGFHSTKALSSEFLKAQIIPYIDPTFKLRLSEAQNEILIDIESHIGCLNLIEKGLKSRQEKEKATLILELKKIETQLESTLGDFNKCIKSLLPDHYYSTHGIGNLLEVYRQIQFHLHPIADITDWSPISQEDIQQWTSKATIFIQSLERILSANPQLTKSDSIKSIPVKERLSSALHQSFLRDLEVLKYQLRDGDDADDGLEKKTFSYLNKVVSEPDTPFSATRLLNEILSTIREFPPFSHEDPELLQITDLLHQIDQLSLVDLIGIVNVLFNKLSSSAKDQMTFQDEVNQLGIFVGGFQYLIKSALKATENRKQIMLFAADELLCDVSEENASLAKDALSFLVPTNYLPRLPLKSVVEVIQKVTDRLEQADLLLNSSIDGINASTATPVFQQAASS